MAIQEATNLAGLNRQQLLDLHYQMYLLRRFEEKAAELYTLGKIGGFLHLYIGQEAVAVGAIPLMRQQDIAISSYREHGHALVKGVDPKPLMAELCGKSTGVSKGKGGSMHIFDTTHNMLGGYAIVAAQLPLACGYGLAAKMMQRDYITTAFFGDGAVDEGAFHEAMNLASLWKLPVIYVCENNLYSMGMSVEKAWAVPTLEPRAAAYAMDYERIDGQHVLEVRAAFERALNRAKNESKPTMLEVMTYRFRGHSMADPAAYRSKEEAERWRSTRDPITLFENQLREAGIATDRDFTQADERATKIIEEAAEFADNSPFPDLSELTSDIMVDPTGAIAWRHQR